MAIFIYPKRESISSKAVKLFLRTTGRKKKLVKVFKAGKFDKQFPAPIPSSLKELCKIEHILVSKRKVWILTPNNYSSNKSVFYSHGGGHVNNIIPQQWSMIEYLIKRTNARFVVPDYPLLPQSNYEGTYQMVEETFKETMENIEDEQITLLGDSAGGAISLTLAQILRNKNISKPAHIILISPELDASKLHEDIIPIYAKHDVILSPEIYDLIGPSYVGNCPRDNFMVSPSLGNLDDLGRISIFTSTHDIMHPYSLDFKKRLEGENVDFDFFLYPKMIHVWTVLTFLKEARFALNQISKIITQNK